VENTGAAHQAKKSVIRAAKVMRQPGPVAGKALKCPSRMLINRGSRLQVYLFPLALDNASPNLLRALPLLVLRVTVIKLFQAGGALRSMSVFETTMQAVVTHSIAIAIAGLLMQNYRDLGCQFISVGLKRILRILGPELFLAQDGGKLGTGLRGRCVIGWDTAGAFFLE
jgi:hypothetical protein